MKCLRRNKTEFELLPYIGAVEVLTDGEEHTGEYELGYGEPITYRGNISSPNGSVNQTFYGQDIRYTHTLVMDNPNVDIHEGDMIRWKNELYDVRAVRPSINSVSIALQRQTADNVGGEN